MYMSSTSRASSAKHRVRIACNSCKQKKQKVGTIPICSTVKSNSIDQFGPDSAMVDCPRVAIA